MKRFLDSYGMLIQIVTLGVLVGMFYATSMTHATREEAVLIAEKVVARDATTKTDGAVILVELGFIRKQLDNLQLKR